MAVNGVENEISSDDGCDFIINAITDRVRSKNTVSTKTRCFNKLLRRVQVGINVRQTIVVLELSLSRFAYSLSIQIRHVLPMKSYFVLHIPEEKWFVKE